MPLRFAPNLSMLYPDVPFLDRFARAKAAGFRAVEFLFPYEFGADAVKQRLDEQGLTPILFNINPGNTQQNERGALSIPARRDFFRQSFEEAMAYAQRFACPRLHCMVGNRQAGLTAADQVECALENLAWAAPRAAEIGVTLLIEPLNAVDMPEYLVHTTAEAMQIVRGANQPNVRLQFDFYHTQMTEGNLIQTVTTLLPYIGHIQISDAPGRHQPGTGEINYPNIFATLERLGYSEPIGLEYRPQGDTDASLAWLPREQRG